jgi:hypothetical protein
MLRAITFCELGFLQQIGFACLGDSAQGGQQIDDEKQKSAGLLESAGNHQS